MHGRQGDGAGGGWGLEIGMIIQPGDERGGGPVRETALGVADHLCQRVDGFPALPLRPHSRWGLRIPADLGQHLVEQPLRAGSRILLCGAAQPVHRVAHLGAFPETVGALDLVRNPRGVQGGFENG